MKSVKARKDHVVGLSNRGVERSLKNLENCRVYEGHARFVSAHEVEVGTETLSAERIFINVGGRAAVPEIPGLDQVDYLTNSSMMDIDFLPPHLRFWAAATSAWNSARCTGGSAAMSRSSSSGRA